MVDGLLPADFSVYENNVKQKLSFFSADPFALSVAIVLDLGMSDSAVQEVNQTFPALVGSFAPYDEVALYTFSSTVSEVNDFSGATQKLSALLNRMRTTRGKNDGRRCSAARSLRMVPLSMELQWEVPPSRSTPRRKRRAC